MDTLHTAIGLFNIFVGLVITAAFLAYGIGMITYLVRIGTIHRESGIRIMEMGVRILFILIILLAIAQFFQNHRAAATAIVAALIAILIIVIVLKVFTEKPKKEEK